MRIETNVKIFKVLIMFVILMANVAYPQTVALWLFDEQQEIYPSCVLNDFSENDFPLVIGPGGRLVDGKFGNALSSNEYPEIVIPEGELEFGLQKLPVPDGRTVEPMTWFNAKFCALMTSGENHLRKNVGFVQPTKTKLNLGEFDWTVEFWFKKSKNTGENGIVFEIGSGPRGENEKVTRLVLNTDLISFTLTNEPSGTKLNIPSKLSNKWTHLAFVYSSNENQLRHFVNGKIQKLPQKCQLNSLEKSDEDYFCLGRDGKWKRPLQGIIDELRFSEGTVYTKNFDPPASFAPNYSKFAQGELKKGPALLFGPLANKKLPVQLEYRKHLFIDDALLEKKENVKFVLNPPQLKERVIDNIFGHYRKHLTVVEDEQGLLRMYNSVQDDYLQVMTSKDGINWKMPYLGKAYRGHHNIVIHEPVGGLGNPFIDPNGPADFRWKYITGFHNRGIYVYTSPDGWKWTRHKTYVLPFRSGTQACTFYDDQRQLYVGYHRTGFAKTPAGATQRESSLAEVRDLYTPWYYKHVTQEETWQASKENRFRDPQPWYLDNGPLTSGGFSLEFPRTFKPDPEQDPVGTDIYITKAVKYPWASDTYFAFPIVYFHYEKDGPVTRQVLMDEQRKLGSGPVETQIAVSRDGINWKRYYRPAYVGIGNFGGWDIHQSYMGHGMVKRENEIWQYFFGLNEYHSSHVDNDEERGVYRVVQRIDGFISIDTPYDKIGTIITKPFVFKGNRLILNIDTDAAGYGQVGFLDKKGKPIKGFSVDDCIYINGDFFEYEVEWLKKGNDLTVLEGKTVQLVFHMRGSKLYSMQFVHK